MNQTNIDGIFDDQIQALPTPQQGCQYHNQNTTSVARSQQNYVIRVTNAEGFTTFVWTGDRYREKIIFFLFPSISLLDGNKRPIG